MNMPPWDPRPPFEQSQPEEQDEGVNEFPPAAPLPDDGTPWGLLLFVLAFGTFLFLVL